MVDKQRESTLVEPELTQSAEADHGESLRGLLSLVRLQESCPPVSLSDAMLRAQGQILTLSAIEHQSVGVGWDGLMSASDWCASFTDSIERGYGNSVNIAFSGRSDARISASGAHSLGLVLGELLSDACERSMRNNPCPWIEVALVEERPGRLKLSVRDESPSSEIPLVAAMLSASMGIDLLDRFGAERTERDLVFSPRALGEYSEGQSSLS